MIYEIIKRALLIYITGVVCCSCQPDENNLEIIPCNSNCDSIYEDFEGSHLKGIFTYYNGRREGYFVLFEGEDTIYGIHEYFGGYLKRTLKTPEKNYVVDIFKIENGEYRSSELISYNKDNQVIFSQSHFINIATDSQKVIIQPMLQGKYDSLSLFSGQTVLKRESMAIGFLKIKKDSLLKFDDLSLFVFENLGKNDKDETMKQGFTLPLTTARLKDDFIKPSSIIF